MESKPLILILVSHPVVGELTAYRLRLLDMLPKVVAHGDELHEQISESLPHAIMIDLDLVEEDGLLITEKLASDEITSRIPVICMSAEGDLAKAEQAFSSGAKDFLVIPYDPIVLERKVSNALHVAEERRKQEAQESSGLAWSS